MKTNSKLLSQPSVQKLPAVTTLDPHIYDPSTKSSLSPSSNTSLSASDAAALSSKTFQSHAASTTYSDPTISSSRTIDEYSEKDSSETNVDLDTFSETTDMKYLDSADCLAAKKMLGKLCKTMVKSSCHHGKKGEDLNKNHEKLQCALMDSISVVNDFVVDFDLKIAQKVDEMLEAIDPEMKMLEEISHFSAGLDALEEYLDLTAPEIIRDLNTIERAKANLQKQKELELQVNALEEQSLKHRDIFNALEMDHSRSIRHAFKVKEPNLYGVSEKDSLIPFALADLTEFEGNMNSMKGFYGEEAEDEDLPECFVRMDSVIARVKEGLSSLLMVENPYVYPVSPSPSMNLSMISQSTSLNSPADSFVLASNALEDAISRASLLSYANANSPVASMLRSVSQTPSFSDLHDHDLTGISAPSLTGRHETSSVTSLYSNTGSTSSSFAASLSSSGNASYLLTQCTQEDSDSAFETTNPTQSITRMSDSSLIAIDDDAETSMGSSGSLTSSTSTTFSSSTSEGGTSIGSSSSASLVSSNASLITGETALGFSHRDELECEPTQQGSLTELSDSELKTAVSEVCFSANTQSDDSSSTIAI